MIQDGRAVYFLSLQHPRKTENCLDMPVSSSDDLCDDVRGLRCILLPKPDALPVYLRGSQCRHVADDHSQ